MIRLFPALLCIGAGSLLLAQDTPVKDMPVKTGLWEEKMNMSGAMGMSNSSSGKSCITPESWQAMLDQMSKPKPDCDVKQTKTSSGYTFEGDCARAHGLNMHVKGSLTIETQENVSSEAKINASVAGKSFDVNYRLDARWVSSNCGNMKPGEYHNDSDK